MQTTEPTLAEQVIQLKLDAESKRILDQIEPSNRDAYINEAIKSFQKSQSGKGATNAAPQSAAADLTNLTNAGQARAHFERIFGNDFAFVDCRDVDGDAKTILLVDVKTREQATVEATDAIDILKSLRQPITLAEVWEIMKAIAVG